MLRALKSVLALSDVTDGEIGKPQIIVNQPKDCGKVKTVDGKM